MAPPSTAALSAYRQVLRSTRIAFHNDHRVFLAARQEARRNFDENRRVGIDNGMQINHAIEVANILRHNIVQGAREAENETAKWELNIHDQIERGDNDSIKVDGKDVKIHKSCSS
ncbi:Mitochondrial zinc maintenance protein 1 [Penicillium taxi]|uniref:Mitochondrial zinc maintenance protein 1 n=1 Tax=Penicillium taxi TaxID=168475 RepID=UPI002544EB52|nr:Mitochondrial zinc maintenance protein 1 [Penicillium taxi]KAJ5885388.1 Mitochondrial zinc maintenance protein 1 [Penicillium taxi]